MPVSEMFLPSIQEHLGNVHSIQEKRLQITEKHSENGEKYIERTGRANEN